MTNTHAMTFRHKLFLFAALTSGSGLAIAAGAAFIGEWREIHEETLSHVSAQTDIVAANLSAALSFDDAKSAAETLAAFRADSSVLAAFVCKPDQSLFSTYSVAADVQPSYQCGLPPGHTISNRRLTLVRDIRLKDETIGTVIVYYGLDMVYTHLFWKIAMTALILGAALVAAQLVASPVRSALLRPVSDLARAAHAISDTGNYDTRVVKHADDELGHLADAFNLMVQQVQNRDTELRNARDELEQRVQERTAELESSNKALEESVTRTQSILDSALDVIISMDAGGVITAWNPQAEKVFGWTADEAVGRKLAETIMPERFRDTHRAALGRFLQTGEGRVLNKRVELSALHRDGREFPVEISLSAVASDGGYTFNGFLRDITERLQQEQELRKLSRVIEQTSVSVMITDVEERIEFVNQAFVDITGYTPEEVVGNNPRLLKSGLTPAQTYSEMWNELSAGRDWRGELRNRRKKGDLYWTLAIISPLQDAQGKTTHYVAVYENITARKQMEEDLRSAARTDKLTGLPNRALLLDRLQHAIERAKRLPEYHFAVMFLDLDRFKIINDSLGHEVGDMLLRTVAARLRESLRAGDSMSRDAEGASVARLGGDEFVILLDCIKKPEDAATVADRLLKALEAPYQLGEHEVHSTASIGIVCSHAQYDKAEDILRDADTAMYEAKARGPSCFVMFDASMQAAVQNRLQIENDLRAAIGLGCRMSDVGCIVADSTSDIRHSTSDINAGDATVATDQFFLVYQPIVSLEDGELRGVEALIRWKHPTRGLVLPGEFIPIAEETLLILPLSNWILEQACAQFMKWRRQAPDRAPGYISVNLSRIHLAEQDLVEQIVRVVQRAGMEPAQLQLEMTESGILQDRKTAKKVLSALKAAGIRLAMDDFGTGQSSLSCLHELPFDVLKIDRSFVSNLERGRQFIAMARTVVTLAENLGMTCVAEGVENRAQTATLKSIGCTCAQGYYFGKPMSAEALIEGKWMDQSRSTERDTSRLMV